ncbi:MAG: hypothetical protein ACREF7_04205 [Candidatus Saccharimonadales bacterium]
MRRIIRAVLVLSCTSLMFIPALAGASSYLPDCNPGGAAYGTSVCNDVNTQSSDGGNVVIRLISDAINVLSVLVGAAAIIIIIISGIRLVTSGGDSSAVSGAKSGIFAAIIGIVIVALAQTIVILVLDNIK